MQHSTQMMTPALGERLYQALAENTSVGIGQMTLDHQLVYANPTLLSWFGVKTLEEISGHRWREFFSPVYQEVINQRVAEQAVSGPSNYDIVVEPRTGRPRVLQVTAVPVADADGVVRISVATLIDVTEQRQAHSRLETVLESIDIGILAVDRHDRILLSNRQFREMWNVPQDIIDRKDNLQLIDHAMSFLRDENSFIERRKQFLASGESEFYHVGELKDGRFCEFYLRKFPDETSGIVRVIVTRDVTDRKRFEQRLIHADRMASVGTLAAGIAHEINNPLTHIAGGLELVYERVRRLDPKGDRPELAEVYKLMDLMLRSSGRIADIVGDLKTFSRSDDSRVTLIDVNEAIDLTLPLVESHARHRARIVRERAPLPPVRANPNRVGQVLMNLVLNAAQAIPEGRYSESQITIRTRTDSGRSVIIEVADTGEGIAPEIQKRIFEPFFTTKPVGTGTGLGLFISYNIVRSMGGEIEVESELGRGTLFRIILPVAQPEMDRVSVKEGEKLAREGRRSGKILIIDDEDAILSMLEAALEGDHAIATARNAREAIQRLESSSEAFDLVLCDLMMPDMDGMRLFQELTARWPELEPKWAFITGGAVNQEIRSFVQNTTRPVLHKPFSLKVIREFVRSSLS